MGRCWGIVGGVAASLPPLWIADQVRNDVTMRRMEYAPRYGYCLKASMTSHPGRNPPPPCIFWVKSSMTVRGEINVDGYIWL